MLEVTEVKYVSGYTLQLSFSDGAEGTVDLEDSLWGPVFEPLKDVAMFKQAFLSSILHTVAWPNDADFAPEYLREKLNKRVQPVY
jgi:hypothetical protein